MDITSNFTYYAFISHSHKDARWARWIQKALECYRLPSAIRKGAKRPLPKKLTPIFRDETDLGTGRLLENIHKELAASRYLIVICSPDSAVPNEVGKHWVDEEVRYFADELGRADAIIPVLVGETPADAFCPKLKELDLLAIEATKIKRRRVLNDVVAKLLGLRPDELWRREIRRRRVRNLVYGIVGVLLIVVLALWSEANRECVKYFKSHSERWGIDFGDNEISPIDDGVDAYYKFVYQGYRCVEGRLERMLRMVVCIDSNGQERKFPHIMRSADDSAEEMYSRRIYRYDDSNRLMNIAALDEKGVIRCLVCYENGRRDKIEMKVFDEYGVDLTSDNVRMFGYFSGDGRLLRSETISPLGIREISYYDDEERMFRIEYRNALDQLCPGRGEVAVVRVLYNEQGREDARLFYNKDEERCFSAADGGVSGWTNEYNEAFTRARRTFVDRDDKKMKNNIGRATAECQVDNKGLIREVTFFDDNDVFLQRKRFVHDSKKRIVEESTLDICGHLLEDSSGVAFGLIRYLDDENIEQRRFFGANSNACLNAEGAAGYQTQKDEKGNSIAISSLGRDWKVCNNKFGFSTIRHRFDSLRRVTDEWYEDDKGASAYHSLTNVGKIAKVHIYYSGDAGFIKEIEVLDGSVWKYIRFYNIGSGTIWKVEYLNAARALVMGPNGWAYFRMNYNEYGELTECSFYDEKSNLTTDAGKGFAIFVSQYDHSDSGVSVSFHCLNPERFHVDSKLFGCAACNVKYDHKGRPIAITRFDARQKAIKMNNGFDTVKIEYDNQDRVSRIWFDNFNVRAETEAVDGKYSEIGVTYTNEGGVANIAAYDCNKNVVSMDRRVLESQLVLARKMAQILRYRRNFVEGIGEEVLLPDIRK